MSARILIRPKARTDVDDTAEYIGCEDPDASAPGDARATCEAHSGMLPRWTAAKSVIVFSTP